LLPNQLEKAICARLSTPSKAALRKAPVVLTEEICQ
jgi:hypothetical protein